MKKEYLDLAYAFRKSKIWKKIYEEELFAVRLPKARGKKKDEIGYCVIMGRNGEHLCLAVYIGDKGFSTLRELMSGEHEGLAGLLSQDCIQCSMETREEMEEEELEELRAYCQASGKPFRAPFPRFARFMPHCFPWFIRKPSDWQAIAEALRVVNGMAAVMTEQGKEALGLRPVKIGLAGQAYGAEQMSLIHSLPTEEVTIPLYSLVGEELKAERIPLPPCREKNYPKPARINDIAVAKMMKSPQVGTLQCEVIRASAPVEGDPPYVPALLMTVDEAGMVHTPALGHGPEYDPDDMLEQFIASLEGSYPANIRVRTEETRALLEGFCSRAKIRLETSGNMDLLDKAAASLEESMMNGADEDGMVEETIRMLEAMPEEAIREMPDFILNQLMSMTDLLPEALINKLQRAMK